MSDELIDIPKNDVSSVVQDAIDGGETNIECFEQPNGKWTVKTE